MIVCLPIIFCPSLYVFHRLDIFIIAFIYLGRFFLFYRGGSGVSQPGLAGEFALMQCSDYSDRLSVYPGTVFAVSPAFWGGVLVMGAINNLLPFFLIAWGQVFVTGGMASIINANTAFFGVLISAIFLQAEPLRLYRLIGVALGIAGVATAIGFEAIEGTSASIYGSLAILAATLSYALAGVWGKLKLAGWPAIEVACGMLICSASLSVPSGFILSGMPSLSLFQLENLPALLQLIIGIGILGTALAYPLYFRILALAGASNLLLVTIIVPVFAVGWMPHFWGNGWGCANWPDLGWYR